MLKILPIIPSELPKILTHYSYFIPTSSPIIPTYSCKFIVSVIIMSTIHTMIIASVDFSSESI